MQPQLKIDTASRNPSIGPRSAQPRSARARARASSTASTASTLSVASPSTSSTNASSTSLPLVRSTSPEYAIDPDADLALAVHEFIPETTHSTYLTFKIRQVIIVHNRDPSGWWDGELLGAPERRGWFPSNYVREYSVDELEADIKRHKEELSRQANGSSRPNSQEFATADPWYTNEAYCPPVMNAIIHGMNVLNTSIQSNRSAHVSPSVACIIQGVRTILDAADCRTRDTPTIRKHPVLLGERTNVLDSLKLLVKQSTLTTQTAAAVQALEEAIEHTVGRKDVDLPEPEDQEELRASAKREADVLLRVSKKVYAVTRHFLATATQCGVELPERRSSTGLSNPPADSEGAMSWSGSQEGDDSKDATARLPPESPGRRSKGVYNTPNSVRSRSMVNLRSQRSGSVNSSGSDSISHVTNGATKAAQPSHDLHQSQLATSPSRHQSPRSGSISSILSQSSASSISSLHSTSTTPHSSPFPCGPTPATQILEVLRHTHDNYISTIAAFVGHAHSHSRSISHAASTGHMYDLVREVVNMVSRLLAIVDAVAAATQSSRSPITPSRVDKLRHSKESLHTVTNRLDESVRLLTVSIPLGVTEEEERNSLLRDATLALKAAADCVFAVKARLSRPQGEHPLIINMPTTDPSAPKPATPKFETPRLGRSTSHAELSISSPVVVDEDMTIRPVHTRPASTAVAPVMTAESSESSESSSASKLSIDTRPSSVEEGNPAASLTSPTPSILSRTDDGSTWEGSLSQQPTPIDQKILHGDLPALPGEEAELVQDPVSWMFSHDYALEDIAYNSDGHIVGATIPVLVEKLTPHDSMIDSLLQTVFFLTFRLFSSPLQLVDAIIARYNLVPPRGISDEDMALWQQRKGLPVRLRVSNFIKIWVEEYWRSGPDDPAIEPLLDFTKGALASMFSGPTEKILDALERRKLGQDVPLPANGRGRMHPAALPLNPPTAPPTTDVPRPTMNRALLANLRNKNFSAISITDFDALELARQMTIMECNLYCAIKPEEVLETGMENAPRVNVKKMSSLSTFITGWVAESILNEHDLKKRTLLVKFFIKVADRCASLNNFSTSRSILAALDSSTISRLTQTWMGLPQKNKAQLDSLRRLADHGRNYQEYRSRLRNTHPPAVPFLGLYLTDVTFCREGNPSYRSSPTDPSKKLINFNKYHKLWRIVQDVQRFQVPYRLKPIPEAHDYLNAAFEAAGHHGDLQDLYRRSLLIEPKQNPNEAPAPEPRPLFTWGRQSTTLPPMPTS